MFRRERTKKSAKGPDSRPFVGWSDVMASVDARHDTGSRPTGGPVNAPAAAAPELKFDDPPKRRRGGELT